MDPQGQLGKVFGLEVARSRRSSIELLVDSVLGDPLDGPGPERAEARGGASPSALGKPALTGALPVVHTRIPGLDVVVANKSLALFPAWEGPAGADAAADPTGRLDAALRRTREVGSYDFVFFDAPPSFGPLGMNVLRAAEELVVPVPLTYLALDGCAELTRSVQTIRLRYGHPSLRIAMVVPTFYRRTRLAHEVLERLKTRFPKEIAHTVVGFHVKIDEAQSRGLSIFEYAPADRAARAMAALAEELELRGAPEGEVQA
jgi:chromosome partitioning protein